MYISRKNAPDVHGKKPWWITTLKIAGVTVGVLVVFGLGYGVGSGNLSFSSSAGQNEQLPGKLDYSSIDAVYRALRSHYDGKLDEEKLLDGMKSGLASASGDPYTVYFNAEDARAFNEQLQGMFSGIGAELGQNTQGSLVVVSPIEGFPAFKAGLRPQDVIVSIDGTSTAGLSVEEAVMKIRGQKGTTVSLRILRDKSEDMTFKITRDNIKIKSVKSEIVDGNIGYIDINQFSDDTAALAQAAARDFKEAGVKGVIVDLRGNPGGLVSASTAVSSLWLPEGKTILQERRGNKAASTELANGNDILRGVPTVVLVDAGSASASEITAGALKDNGVATIIGVTTFGKGSVQQIVNLPGEAELKVTIARWHRPNGQNIDQKGIPPDREVTMTNEDYDAGRDPQKAAAIEFLSSN